MLVIVVEYTHMIECIHHVDGLLSTECVAFADQILSRVVFLGVQSCYKRQSLAGMATLYAVSGENIFSIERRPRAQEHRMGSWAAPFLTD